MVPSIDAELLFLRLTDDDFVVVDCRDEPAWRQYRFQIPGSVKMTPDEMRDWAHVLPDDEQIILVGCREDGDDARRAGEALLRSGRSPWRLRGGLIGWIREGFPVEPTEDAQRLTASDSEAQATSDSMALAI